VERVYLEASGLYTIFKAEKPRPGLPILFVDDEEVVEGQTHATNAEKGETPLMACKVCGFVKQKDTGDACDNCGQNNWVKAII